jgi:methylenetetrahydrofolate reductase (NADPH)
MSSLPFEVICEIQPSTRPDLMQVRHQIGVLSCIAAGFLIPDNHLGRATISSVAVAHEVNQMGGRAIACLNARDRNLLGLRRDLMTAAAYGVDEFLLVFGDRPTAGARTGELTVRSMLHEVRQFSEASGSPNPLELRAGVTSRLTAIPDWKRDADFFFVQASFDRDDLLRWREGTDVRGKVFAGVLVPPSASRARKWAAEMPEVSVPDSWVAALDRDPNVGVDLSCELALAIRDSGAFDGVHLIPGIRYRAVAARLEGDQGIG